MQDVLDGVVALVGYCSAHWPPRRPPRPPAPHAATAAAAAQVVAADPSYNAKPAIQRTLGQLGARVVSRLSKEVTHVVYERRAPQQRGGRDRAAEQELQELYKKVDKLDPRPAVVCPRWALPGAGCWAARPASGWALPEPFRPTQSSLCRAAGWRTRAPPSAGWWSAAT